MCRKAKKEPDESKDEVQHPGVKQQEDETDEEEARKLDEAEDVQVRDIRYNLENLAPINKLTSLSNDGK